jgi:hypothetical protein
MKMKRVGMGCVIQMGIRHDPLHPNRAGRLDHRQILSVDGNERHDEA